MATEPFVMPARVRPADISYTAVRDGRRCPLPDQLRSLIPRVDPDAETLLAALHWAQAALYDSGDTSAIEPLLDPEVVWQIPGNNLIAGTYHGMEQVITYMLRRRSLANATFRMHRREILIGPSHFAALTDGTAERHGTSHHWSTIGLYRTRNGRISECTLIPLDPAAFDAAWQ